jgi:hypothetical protein
MQLAYWKQATGTLEAEELEDRHPSRREAQARRSDWMHLRADWGCIHINQEKGRRDIK